MNKATVINNLNPLFMKAIAHRGYFNDQDTENGLHAFKNAIDHNFAIELDVHLTKDNQLMVCHDEQLKRTTGKEGIIEDLTVDEIKKGYHLLDGEEVPTFQEVLNLVKEQVPIVVELKVFRKNYKPLAKRLKEELENIKNKKNIMLISFDPRSLLPFRKSGYMRSLLVAKSHLYTYMFRHLFESVDLEYVLFEKKRIANYHKRHLVNCWTIQDEKTLDFVLPYTDTITFQKMDCDLVRNKLLSKNS